MILLHFHSFSTGLAYFHSCFHYIQLFGPISHPSGCPVTGAIGARVPRGDPKGSAETTGAEQGRFCMDSKRLNKNDQPFTMLEI